jgi:hypothetical protein
MGYLVELGLAIGGAIPSGVFVVGSATQGIIGTNTIGTFDMLADYSSRLQSVSTQRSSDRTTRALVAYSAGTATVRLLNLDGDLDPYVLEQAGLTAPGVIMRLRYRADDGTVYPVFWGYVDSWDPLADSPEVGTVTVTATDGFILLNQKLGVLGSPVGANESVQNRATRILDALGYSTTLRSLGATSEILQATSFDANGLALIQEAVEAEAGEFYQQPDGVMYLRGRQAIVTDTRSTTSQATFGSNRAAGEIPYVGRPVTSWNKLGMHNRVVAQIDGSTNPQIAEDAAAISLYGTEYTLEKTTLKLTTDASALSWANFVLANDVKPTFQFSGITLNSALDTSTIAQQFGRVLGDRVTVVRRPPATPYGSVVDSRDLYIQGISHTWDVKSRQTLTTFDLVPVSKYPALVIGSATQGVIGQNVLAW